MNLDELIEERMLVDFFDSGESKDYNRGRNDGRLQELNLIKSSLVNLEYNRKQEKPPKLPPHVVAWVGNTNEDPELLFDYIVDSESHDNEIPDDVFEWIFGSQENMLLILRVIKDNIYYEVEEVPKYRIACTDGYLSFVKFSNVAWEIETSHKVEDAIVIYSDEKAKQVARLTNGTVVDV